MRRLVVLSLLAAGFSLASAGASSAARIAGVIPDLARGGVSPRALSSAAPYAAGSHAADVSYQGGPVLHFNRTHLIFWAPSGSGLQFDPGYRGLVRAFLSRVAADSHLPTNVYAVGGQYHDSSGPAAYSSFDGGAVLDTDPLPSNYGCSEPLPPPLGTGPGWLVCLSDAQIRAELEHVISSRHLPRRQSDIYFVLTPNGFGTCQDTGPTNCSLGGSENNGYCAYHATTPSRIPYAVLPYSAVSGHCQSDNPRPNGNAADLTVSYLSHEHIEITVDPHLDGWFDSSGNEIGDLCLTNYGPALGGSGPYAYNEVIHGGHYWLQEEYSNDNGSCQAREESDRVSFGLGAARSPHTMRMVARARDPDGSIAAYRWFLSDGASFWGRRVTHRFARPGRYLVVLRVTDAEGNWAFATRRVSVR